MEIKKITEHILEVYRFEPYDMETYDTAAQYIYNTFPGKYILTVCPDNDDRLIVDFEFKDKNEELLFHLKYA